MARNPKEYQRLPGTGTRRLGFISIGVSRSRLYLGSDHLLSINTLWYTETYKRFHFRDIQSFTLRKTNTGKVYNSILIACALIAGVPAFPLENTASTIILLCISGFFLLCLILNAIFGPTCVCELKTAVQTEELPSLSRKPRARKVLKRLRPLIAEAQGGELSPEQVSAQLAQPPQAAHQDSPPIIVGDPNQPPPAAFGNPI